MLKRSLCSLAVLFIIGWSGVADAALTIDPTTFAFGDTPINGAAATMNESITSDSVTGEPLDHFTVTGAGCSVVTITATVPATVSTIAPLAITINYDPTTRTSVSCTVIGMTDNTETAPGVSFTVTGTGTGPVISVPASTAFPDARVTPVTGTSTANVVVTNNGDAGQTLSITALSTTGDYALTNAPTFPINVTSGSSVNINVTFNPTASGTRNGNLQITSNDPATPTIDAPLTGTGTNAVISPADKDFGVVTDNTTSVQNVVISNTAVAPIGVLRVMTGSITGSSWFRFDDNGAGCGGMANCTFANFQVQGTPGNVAIRCTPLSTDTMTTQTATVTFTSDSDSGGDATADLTCTAGRPDITVGGGPLAFGDIVVGQTSSPITITVRNDGNRNLTYSVTKGGANPTRYTLGGACITGCTVAPATQTSFTVTFTPNAAAQQDATIIITSNDPDETTTNLAATGRGVQPNIMASTATVAFGDVEVLAPSGTMPLTITNTGLAPLAITTL